MANDISGEEDSPSDQADEASPTGRPMPNIDKSKKLSFYRSESDDDDESDDEAVVNKFPPTQPKKVSKPIEPKQDLKDLDKDEVLSEQNKKNKEENVAVEAGSSTANDNSKEKRLLEIRAEMQKLRQQFDLEPADESGKNGDSNEPQPTSPLRESDNDKLRIASKKGRQRERETLEMARNFKRKLKEAAKSTTKTSEKKRQSFSQHDDDSLDILDEVDGDGWLQHRFEAQDEQNGRGSVRGLRDRGDRRH